MQYNQSTIPEDSDKVNTGASTVFHEIMTSNLPNDEKTVDRMTQEALSVISAASETSSSVLATTIFHILSNPEIILRLQHELDEAIPNAEKMAMIEWRDLEKLPYLVSLPVRET